MNRPDDSRPDDSRPDLPPARSSHQVLQASMVARLLIIGPLAVGLLLAEAIFAARGDDGTAVALPAAALAVVVTWIGLAWALRSWVAALLTFVPAVITTLGAAMVGDLAPAAGIALICLGGTGLLVIAWSRVTSPGRRWTPGWSATGYTAGADHADPQHADPNSAGPLGADANSAGPRYRTTDRTGASGPGPGPSIRDRRTHDDTPRRDPARRGGGEPGSRPARRREQDAPSKHVVIGRAEPSWDTSATNRRTRDALVLALCHRGGTVGPTLVTLEEFFTGNGDARSIAPGLRGTIPLGTMATILHRLRARGDVAEVMVQVEPLEAGEYPAGEWPVAGSVRVVGPISADDLDRAVEPLRAEPAIGPLPACELSDGRPAPNGSSEFALWWA